MLRAGAFAIIVFQIGYALLTAGISADLGENSAASYRKHYAGPGCAHGNALPACIRNWRAIALAVCSLILLSTAWIAAINGNSDVLIASILLFFLGAGALFPWNPRWQAALEAMGALAREELSREKFDLKMTQRELAGARKAALAASRASGSSCRACRTRFARR